MPQTPGFPPNLKVSELITMFIKLKQKNAIYMKKLIVDLQINKFWHKYFNQLSDDMEQKVNLLQAFMFDNSLFILDEPTIGLDP